MKRNPTSEFSAQRGSALITVILTMMVISLIAANVLSSIASRHVVAHQAPHWHGSFNAAEAGADYGLAALNAGTWTGWSAEGDAASNYQRTSQLVLESSGGAPRVFANVTIDKPSTMMVGGKQHYRVRSTGHSKMTGVKRKAGQDKRDNRLRKISMFANRFPEAGFANTTDTSSGDALVSRRIEAVAKPATKGIFPVGVHCDQLFDVDSQNYFDSYDTEDTAKSTDQTISGRRTFYDPSEKQKNGDIATNSSNGWDLNKATILGDVLANGAPYIKGDDNLDGQKRTDFYTPMSPVPAPTGTWTNQSVGKNNTTTLKNGAGSGTKTDPRRYKMSNIEMDTGAELRLSDGDGDYVEVWVTGDVVIANGAKIKVGPNVHLTLYFEGKFQQLRTTGN